MSTDKIFTGFLLIASLAILTWVSVAPVVREGDGTEYFFQTYQFSRHGQLSGSKTDIKEFSKWISPVEKLYFDIDAVPEYPNGCGFTRKNDVYYTHHFGFYSILASIPAVALRVLHLNEHRALNVTNGLLFLAALWCAWLLLPWRRSLKITYVLFVLFSPAVSYLTWPHTEVYLFSFVVLSLVTYLRGYLKTALFFASVASMQNQVLGLYVFALVCLFVKDQAVLFKQTKRIAFREWVLVICAGLPSLIPGIYYMLHLGVPSLLGGMCATSSDFMSLRRVWSLFTDLNQGMVVASISLVVMFGWYIFRCLLGGSVSRMWIAWLSLALAYSVTSICNWNSGCNGVMRYATWIYCFVLTFVVSNLAEGLEIRRRLIMCVLLVMGTFVQFCYLPWSGYLNPLSYLKLRPIAAFVWERFPALYSPEPDIFLTRTKHCGECSLSTMPENQAWGIYVGKQGKIRKIYSTYETLMRHKGVDFQITDAAGFEKLTRWAKLKPDRCQYFDISHDEIAIPPISTNVEHFADGNGKVFLGEGFTSRESWGVWSDCPASSFYVALPEADADITLILCASAFYGMKWADVYCNAERIAKLSIESPPFCPADYRLIIPRKYAGKVVSLCFKYHDATRPSSVDAKSTDRRLLGMGFISIQQLPVAFVTSSGLGFADRSSAIEFVRGFANVESWGVWSKAKECVLRINLPVSSDEQHLIVNAQAYMRTKHVDVYSGDRKLAEWHMSASPMTPADYNVVIPPELTGKSLELRLVQDVVSSPHELDPANGDMRTLGIGLISVRLAEDPKK